MGLGYAEVSYFIEQVGMSAASFGVTSEDVMTVGEALMARSDTAASLHSPSSKRKVLNFKAFVLIVLALSHPIPLVQCTTAPLASLGMPRWLLQPQPLLAARQALLVLPLPLILLLFPRRPVQPLLSAL
jgi:hypothetical protein